MDNLLIYARTPLNFEITIWKDLKQRIRKLFDFYLEIPKSLVLVFRKHDKLTEKNVFRSITVICCFLLLRTLNSDRIYHTLKVQSLIRLYVLYGVLELAEKLFETLVDDSSLAIDETLEIDSKPEEHVDLRDESVFSLRTGVKQNLKGKNSQFDGEKNHKGEKSPQEITENFKKNRFLGPVCMFLYISVTLGHTLILYFQHLIILLSLNSSLSSLYSLVVSLQFLELKGNVTKKGDKNALFILIDSDGLKRFNLTIYLTISFLLRWMESESFQIFEYLEPISIIFLFKLTVDWIKHSFFCRYNKIDPKTYSKYEEEYKKRDNFVSHNILVLWLCNDIFRLPLFTFLLGFYTFILIVQIVCRKIF